MTREIFMIQLLRSHDGRCQINKTHVASPHIKFSIFCTFCVIFTAALLHFMLSWLMSCSFNETPCIDTTDLMILNDGRR